MLSEKELQQLNWSTSGKKREKEKKKGKAAGMVVRVSGNKSRRILFWSGGVRGEFTTCPCKQSTATASFLAFTLTGWMDGWMKKEIFCYQISDLI